MSARTVGVDRAAPITGVEIQNVVRPAPPIDSWTSESAARLKPLPAPGRRIRTDPAALAR